MILICSAFLRRSTYPWLSVANRFKVRGRNGVLIPFYLIRPKLLKNINASLRFYDTFQFCSYFSELVEPVLSLEQSLKFCSSLFNLGLKRKGLK